MLLLNIMGELYKEIVPSIKNLGLSKNIPNFLYFPNFAESKVAEIF